MASSLEALVYAAARAPLLRISRTVSRHLPASYLRQRPDRIAWPPPVPALLPIMSAVLLMLPSGLRADSARVIVTYAGSPGEDLGRDVASAGDINGDGYDDVVIRTPGNGGAYVYYGSVAPDAVPDLFLQAEAPITAVASAGDFNGDGFDDLIVGASTFESNRGRACLFLGSANPDNIADLTVTGSTGGTNTPDQLGQAVACAGDFNGDGFDDLIVGVPGWWYDSGCVCIFFGSATPDFVFDLRTCTPWASETSHGGRFGSTLDTAGDFNRDGFDDLIVGEPLWGRYAGGTDFSGRAYLYLGGANPNGQYDLTFDGMPWTGLGSQVRSAGDMNNDGYSDVAIVVSDPYDGAGQVYVYLGGANPNSVRDLTLRAESPIRAVAHAGRVNGDAFSDLLLGAPGFDENTGRVYLVLGSQTPDATADVVLTGEAPGGEYGRSLSGAGDINGDREPDLLIGAPRFDQGAGRAYGLTIGPGLLGTVRDAHNSAAIEGALVTLFDGPISPPPLTTGPDGRYAFVGLPEGAYTVTAVREDGYYSTNSLSVQVPTYGDVDITMRSKAVVLVHGICSTPNVWNGWTGAEGLLEQAGFAVLHNTDLEPNTDHIPRLASQMMNTVNPLLEAARVHSFHIVSKSMGAPVSRFYAAQNLSTVDELLMLGAPNHGSRLASWAQMLAPTRSHLLLEVLPAIFGHPCEVDPLTRVPWAVFDLTPNNRTLNELNYGDRNARIRHRDCMDQDAERRIDGDLTHYWSIGGQCSEGAFAWLFPNQGCANDGVVSNESMQIHSGWWCPTSELSGADCDVHHAMPSCPSIQESQCVRDAVLAILAGGALPPDGCHWIPEGEASGAPNVGPREADDSSVMYQWVGTIDANSIRVDTVYVSSGTRAAFMTFGVDRPRSYYLLDPLGTVIDSAYAETAPDVEYVADGGLLRYEVQEPSVGMWRSVTETRDGESERATIVFADGASVLRLQVPGHLDPGMALPIVTAYEDASGVILGAMIAAEVATPDSASQLLELYDDGQHGDGEPNDGTYGNEFGSTSVAGAYVVVVSARTQEAVPRTAVENTSVLVESLPDPAIAPEDVFLDDPSPASGDTVMVSATVRNAGSSNADSLIVEFSDNGLGAVFYRATITDLPAGGAAPLDAFWLAATPPHDHVIRVHVLTLDGSSEVTLYNNLAALQVYVHAASAVPDAPPLQATSADARSPSLLVNKPNPFNPMTTFTFFLPRNGWARLTIYDAGGRFVARPIDGQSHRGYHEAVWDGRGADHRVLPSGVYFYRLEAGGYSATGRMTMTK